MQHIRTLREGDRGDDVKALQTKLNELMKGKSAPLPVTGYFGTLTKHAVLALQKMYQIEQDGVVGVRTRAAMNMKVVVLTAEYTPQPKPNAPQPPRPPQTQPQTPQQPQNRVINVPKDLPGSKVEKEQGWNWFAMQIQMFSQVQNPGIVSGVLQLMPTLRLKPLSGAYFQARETHIELGLGLGYGINTITTGTDPRHTISIVAQGTLVDPFTWGRWHTQFFGQAGLAINGIPYGTPYNWYLTHYVLQAYGGGQVGYDLIPNRWNLFLQAYGGGQYDATSKDPSWLYGAALGTGVSF